MNEPITLRQLFSNRFFRVPDYQRGYAWGEDQLNDLWQDLSDLNQNADGSYRRHYTGTIYVERMEDASLIPEGERWARTNSSEFFYVVDGQQRLTTLAILMNELCNAERFEYSGERIDAVRECFVTKVNAANGLKVDRFGYAAEAGEDPVDSFFKVKVLERNEDVPPVLPDTVYTRNLIFAKSFFQERIAQMDKPGRESLFQKVTNSLCFSLYELAGDLDVQAVFETMNNRGKPLTALEKLKNRLMFLTERLPEEREVRIRLRRSIHNAWKSIYSELARVPDRVLDEDEFLSAHLSVYRKPEYEVFSVEAAEKRLFEMFSMHAESYPYETGSKRMDDAVSARKIREYVADLSAFARPWSEVLLSPDEQMEKIVYLDGGKYVKVALAALKKAGGRETGECLNLLENLFFRNTINGAWVMGPDAIMSHVRALYRGECAAESFRAWLKDEIVPASAEAVASSFAHLYDYSREVGFFKWNKNALHYLLFEYERELKKNYEKNFDRIDFHSAKGYAIEHILPQTWETYWRATVEDFVDDPDADSQTPNPRKVLINTLGNLVLLDASTNSAIGNNPWELKHKRLHSGKSYGEYDVGSHETWGKREIEARGRDILKFLGGLIGCTFNEEQVQKALFASPKLYAKGFADKTAQCEGRG